MSLEIRIPGIAPAPEPRTRVLAVDDDALNLEVLNHILEGDKYDVANAEDGMQALEYLADHPDGVDIILLDKMMPKMNGIELLKRLKTNPKYRDIPVIMQTASVSSPDVVEGIEAGAYYYVTKPFNDEMILSIVEAATREYSKHRLANVEVDKGRMALDMIIECHYQFRTIEQAQTLATVIANYFIEPHKILIGLLELMLNAVEHGNLGIGYKLKTELLNEGNWQQEINRRLGLVENRDKQVRVTYRKNSDSTTEIIIADQGNGFEWKRYLDFDPIRMTDPNGRGIAKAKIMAFSKILFNDIGNQVTCVITS